MDGRSDTLDDFDVIRSTADLERHMTGRGHTPAWVLLSPSMLPGAYLIEQARGANVPVGELARAIEGVLQAMGSGDAAGMVRGWIKLATSMEGLYGRALRDAAEEAARAAVAEERRRARRASIRVAVKRAGPGENVAYEVDLENAAAAEIEAAEDEDDER